MFEIAAILINYNSSTHTINCINSIIEKTNITLKYQLVIIDNCSKENDFSNLKKFCTNLELPNLKLIRNNINSGFGAGNMLGALYANAKYLAFINNDTILKNDCFTILKNEMENNPEIGIAGGQSYTENGDFMVSSDHLASPAREILGRNFLEFINPKKYPKRKKKYTSPTKVGFVPGSLMLVRTADFDAIGGFDTNIFLYYEETDICKRLLKNNKYAYLIPQAEFIHLHGASTEKSLSIKKELKISLLYVIRKHYGLIPYLILLLFLQIRYFFTSFFKYKYISLFYLLALGAPISKSLKNKQKIIRSL